MNHTTTPLNNNNNMHSFNSAGPTPPKKPIKPPNPNSPKIGNLGATLIKRSYLAFELSLQFFGLADLVARLEARWALKNDRPYIISVIVLLGITALTNIIICFLLAFRNSKLPPSVKKTISKCRNYSQMILIFPCCILIAHNSMHLLFSATYLVCWMLFGIHLHHFLKEELVPLLICCFPGMEEFRARSDF